MDMPGTRNMRKFGTEASAEGGKSRVEAVAEFLRHRPSKQRPGFAVAGSGLKALKQAQYVFADDEGEIVSLRSDRDTSLIFFSYEFGYYVHITSVEAKNRSVTITYEFVPHLTNELTRQLAIIPLGNLDAGEWEVKLNQAPLADKYKDMGAKNVVAPNVVCGPFSFKVEDAPK